MTTDPSTPSVSDVVALAVGLHQRGHLDEAEELYERVLEIAPDHADALHFYGVLNHQRGDSEAAVRLIRRALKTDSQYVGARINLGNVLREQGRFGEAESEYRKVIAADGSSADAYNNLGVVLRLQHRNEEAIGAFERATALAPRHADAFQNLGNALKAADRIEEALVAYRTAIEIAPAHSEASLNLGRLLTRINRLDEAAAVYAHWLEVDPSNPIAAHMLAACRRNETPPRCTDEFVRQTFDAIAIGFEETLERLEYRAPLLAAQAIERVISPSPGQLTVLDAGCGTGLCGSRLRSHAKHLVGVDLSPKMVAKARGTGLYDELVVAELTEHMRTHPACYDLIFSTDTFVYFGDLVPLFRAAATATTANGAIVFTFERIGDGESETGYQLQCYGRYGHSEQFVTDSLQQAGFSVKEIRRETLRLEARQPVNGLVVAAVKS